MEVLLRIPSCDCLRNFAKLCCLVYQLLTFAAFVCFRNKLDIVQTDVVDDPTLQRSKNAICEKCNYNEAVFFQADEASQVNSQS